MLTGDIPPNQTNSSKTSTRKSKKKYGRILDIVALKMPKLRGQAWLVFSEVTAASNVIRQMHNFPFYGKPMKEILQTMSGVLRVNTPPPLSSRPVTRNEGGLIVAPKPLRIPPYLVNPLDDLLLP
ncbi:hypothetical protein AgCh_008137 [Apium graveolens]